MADTNTTKQTTITPALVPLSGQSWDLFNTMITSVLGPQDWIGSMWSHSGNVNDDFIGTDMSLDLIMASPQAKADPKLDSFRNMVKIVDDLKQRKAKGEAVHVPTYLEFFRTKEAYGNILQSKGLGNVFSSSELEQMIANDISPQEVSDRVNLAYNAVRNADSALKEQLKKNYPSLNDADMVSAMLRGAQGIEDIQKKINVAGIQSEQSRFGIQSTYSAEELSNMGLQRSDVNKVYSEMQQELPSGQRLASLYGGDPEDVQRQLETQKFTGVVTPSGEKFKKLEEAAFSGASGLTSGSLSKRRSGRI